MGNNSRRKPTHVRRKQCQLRLWEDDWEKLQAKATLDGVSYQQLGELLLLEYIKDNSDIMKIVKKYADAKAAKKKRRYNQFDDLEANEIMKIIEQESPFEDIYEAAEEELTGSFDDFDFSIDSIDNNK